MHRISPVFYRFVHKFNQDTYFMDIGDVIRDINQLFILAAEEDLGSRNMYRREK